MSDPPTQPLGGSGPTESFLQRLGGRYRLQSLLGSGGQSHVYRAYDPELKRSVALKLLPRGSSEASLRRFLREGELTAALDHPGILRVFSSGVFEGHPYLACELIERSRTLDEVMPQLGEEELAALLAQVADAIGYAHARGVVHRDLKPDNVLVDREGSPRVIDFGVALALEGERLTQTGALTGTPHYMAPEQIASERGRIGPPTDVWALGVILYQGLTGALPFAGENLLELANAIAGASPTPPCQLAPNASRELESVCLRALAADPQERFADGAELGAALRAGLAGTGTRSGSLPQAWRRLRRSPIMLLVAPGLALALLGAVALGYRQQERPTRPDPSTRGDPVASRSTLSPAVEVSSPSPRASARLGEGEGLPDLALPALEDEPLAQTQMRSFVEAAVRGETYAMSTLAAYYAKGNAGEKDKERALAWYLRAAERGDAQSMLAAASLLIRQPIGRGQRTRAPAKALDLLQRAYEAGVTSAGRYLAQVYRYGALGLERDRERARQLFREQMNRGDAESAVLLAGDLEAEDPAGARKVLERGDEMGLVDCKLGLARMAWEGIGGPRDPSLALRLLAELEAGSEPYFARLARQTLAKIRAGKPPFTRK